MLLAVLAGAVGGCGVGARAPSAADRPLTPGLSGDVEPDPAESEDIATKRVLLDWTGGSPDITDRRIGPADFSLMTDANGDPLEVDREAFQEAVRGRVEEILSAIEPVDFLVVTGESDGRPDTTTVYFTDELGPAGAAQAGQARLDQCDLSQGGDIVVWGGSLRSLGDGFDFEEWVHLFANVAAHEVGHTVGFFHPDAYLDDLSDYERTVEVMLSVRTLSALRGPQGFVIPQETCPASVAARYGGVAYGLSADSTTRPSAKRAFTTSRAACVCEIVADE